MGSGAEAQAPKKKEEQKRSLRDKSCCLGCADLRGLLSSSLKSIQDVKKEAEVENAKFANVTAFLLKVPLFAKLPRHEMPLLASAMTAVKYKTGRVIIKQGADGHEFFVIISGEAAVFIDGVEVARLREGDHFGEAALLANDKRNATIQAASRMEVLTLTRENFTKLRLNEKLAFANRRRAVGRGGEDRKIVVKEPTPKTDAQKALICEALRNNKYLSGVLDETKIKALTEVAWREAVASGEEIIVAGDIKADYFYIVEDGTFQIKVQGREDEEGELISQVGDRCSFGELALLYLVPRAATVTAMTAASVFVIDRGSFKRILMKATEERISGYVEVLSKVEVLAPLVQQERLALAQALVEMIFGQDEVVLTQGHMGSTFYILQEGEVSVTKDGKEVAVLNAADAPRFFGERALIAHEARSATVTVISKQAKVLALDQEDCNMILGPLEDYLNGGAGRKRRQTVKYDSDLLPIPREELDTIGLLGSGGFGSVRLVQKRGTSEAFALKSCSKGFIVKCGMKDTILNEKSILLMTNSPFIVKLYATYNTAQHVEFLLELALGGELYETYSRKSLHGSEEHAKYYIAGVVFAFEHCHQRKIIYRDLKPENLLFTANGRIKLTDMGLAKFVIGRTFTTCGTPDYFAPEVIRSQGHNSAVDWWTLGVLLFELMSGRAPFTAEKPIKIYAKVLKGIGSVPLPASCNRSAEDLIQSLMQLNPERRLPMTPNGVHKLKNHPWYSGFDWEAMFKGDLAPPYVPHVNSPLDLENFKAREEDVPPVVQYDDDGSGWDKAFA